MERFYIEVFLNEIGRQCGFASRAYEDLTDALDEHNFDKLWYSIQSSLVACANISKLFWPDPRDKPIDGRAEELRQTLCVKDDSPLRSRKLRNHLEHFDNRIEEWIRNSERHNYIDSNIGSIAGGNKQDIMRNFDPDSMTLTFQGEEYELEPMIREVERVHLQLSAMHVRVILG